MDILIDFMLLCLLTRELQESQDSGRREEYTDVNQKFCLA